MTNGYVYILETVGLDLRVCKIGRTTKHPRERCQEINKSSTGDFLWQVRHAMAVDDCVRFESLIHQELASCRQPGREFFNLSADEAYAHVQAALERSDISVSAVAMPPLDEPRRGARRSDGRSHGDPISRTRDQKYAPILHAFASCLQSKVRPFG
ncbi:MAG TPA: GIY-YIG nuclease family protein [Roseiarcus sp.]|jgi:hypothetical protein